MALATKCHTVSPSPECKSYHFHHFWVIKVVDDVFQNVSVWHKAQGTEYNDDGDLLFNVWQDGDDTLTNSTFLRSLHKQWVISVRGSSLRWKNQAFKFTCRDYTWWKLSFFSSCNSNSIDISSTYSWHKMKSRLVSLFFFYMNKRQILSIQETIANFIPATVLNIIISRCLNENLFLNTANIKQLLFFFNYWQPCR